MGGTSHTQQTSSAYSHNIFGKQSTAASKFHPSSHLQQSSFNQTQGISNSRGTTAAAVDAVDMVEVGRSESEGEDDEASVQ